VKEFGREQWQTIMSSASTGLLEATDAEAERRGLTRSAFLTSAALDNIQREISREAKGKADRGQIKRAQEMLRKSEHT
jgi:hypothetical protein